MVRHPKYFDACLLQSLLDRVQLIDRVHFEGEVMNPFWHVAAQRRAAAIANIEERNVRPIAHLKKEMTKWGVLARGRDALGADDVGQGQTQEVFIELPGLLGIDATPSNVVESPERYLSYCIVWRGHCGISRRFVDGVKSAREYRLWSKCSHIA